MNRITPEREKHVKQTTHIVWGKWEDF